MIGIIGAMDIEVRTLSAALENPKTEKISGIEFVSGRYYGKDVVIATSGVGKVFAAIAAEAMILKYNPEVIINSGVAGSLSKDLNVTDIVIAEDLVQHDMDTTPLGDPAGLISGINIVNLPCAKRSVELLCDAVKELGIHHACGRIATGDTFVASVSQKNEIAQRFSAVACEMEGASIAQVCYVNNVDFAAIRSISDSLSDGSDMEYSEFLNVAAKKSIQVIDSFLKAF